MRFKMSTGTMVLLAVSIAGLILYFTSNMIAIDYIDVLQITVLGG